MNLILIAGIKRSGSTIQYNLVRLALEKAGYEVLIRGHSFDLSELDTLTDRQVILCKRHPFHEELANRADHIFLTDRPDEEIIESLTKFNGIKPGQSHIDNMRKHLDRWKQCEQRYIFDYQTWIEDPHSYADDIVHILHLGVDSEAVLEAFNEIEPPESGQDKTTLLFSNHITSK